MVELAQLVYLVNLVCLVNLVHWSVRFIRFVWFWRKKLPMREMLHEMILSGFAGGEAPGGKWNSNSIIDNLVKSQKWDGKVKSSKCKACES